MGLVAHIPFYLLSLLSLRPLCLGHSDCSQFSRPRPIRSKWPLPLRIPPLAFLPPLLLQSLCLRSRNVGLATPWEVNLIPRVRPRHSEDEVDLLRKEVQKLKEGGDPEAVATAEGRASKAQSLAENLRVELDEATRQWESVEKELGETREELVDSRRQLADSQGKLVEFREWLDNSESQL
ncbi:hypothetical protein BHE74_00014581 [Ensete ventricosum]|nr:hypothetical protein BHE74_00014581 [Ensete ventricosum]